MKKISKTTFLLLFLIISISSVDAQVSVYRAKICYRNVSAQMTVIKNQDGSIIVNAVDVPAQGTDKVLHKTILPVTHSGSCVHIPTTGITWWVPFDVNRLPEKQLAGGLRDIECPCPSVNTAEACTIGDDGEDLYCIDGTCDVCCDGVYGDCGGSNPPLLSQTMKGAGIFIQALKVIYNGVVYQ